ncbi:MAG TPA: riboflavin synthase [Gammaproteobacteria bacterium]|jgi:riboflavin synthase
MFTGIIRGIGTILSRVDRERDGRLSVGAGDGNLPALGAGDSIAVNGVCLTVVSHDASRVVVDVSNETRAVTTLGTLVAGSRVNLEPALRVGESLDGHLVTGHVDGVGRVRDIAPDGQSLRLGIELPRSLLPYVARKGSVAVDGVSLTVNAVHGAIFEVNIVPHTREMTIISGYRVGTAVNIEVDIIARYLERLASWASESEAGVNLESLREHGYIVEE